MFFCVKQRIKFFITNVEATQVFDIINLYISQKHHFLPLLKPLLSKTLPPTVGLTAVYTPLDELKSVFVSFYLPDYDLKRFIFVDVNSSIFGF